MHLLSRDAPAGPSSLTEVLLDALKGVRKFSQPGWYGYTQFIALGLLLLSVYLAGDFPDKYDDSDEEYEMPISTPGPRSRTGRTECSSRTGPKRFPHILAWLRGYCVFGSGPHLAG